MSPSSNISEMNRRGRPGNTWQPEPRSVSRRTILRQLAILSAGAPIAAVCGSNFAEPPRALAQPSGPAQHQAPPQTRNSLSPEDDGFLNELEHANFLFFWEQANPQTGLIKDRCNVRAKDTSTAASIASTGFGLTAICIGEKRGFVSRSEARTRVIESLSFLWHK